MCTENVCPDGGKCGHIPIYLKRRWRFLRAFPFRNPEQEGATCFLYRLSFGFSKWKWCAHIQTKYMYISYVYMCIVAHFSNALLGETLLMFVMGLQRVFYLPLRCPFVDSNFSVLRNDVCQRAYQMYSLFYQLFSFSTHLLYHLPMQSEGPSHVVAKQGEKNDRSMVDASNRGDPGGCISGSSATLYFSYHQ